MRRTIGYLILLFLATVALIGCDNAEPSVPQAENPVTNGQTSTPDSTSDNNITTTNNERPLTLGNFTTSESPDSFYGFPGNRADLITFEEARDIGANFILDVLGHDLDGLHMMLTMNHNPQINRNSWFGVVATSADAFNADGYIDFEQLGKQAFMFLIDAVTGERLNLFNHSIDVTMMPDGTNLIGRDPSREELLDLFPAPDADEVANLTVLAREFAERYFIDSNVVNVGINSLFGDGAGSQIAHLWATDDAGRQIELNIFRVTGELWSVNNPDSSTPGN